MRVLLNLYASLEEYSLKAFDALLKYRSSINNEFKQLLGLYKSEVDDQEKEIFKKVLTLARSLPEPFKSQENLKKLVNMFSDKQLYHLFEVSTDINNGCDKIKKAVVCSRLKCYLHLGFLVICFVVLLQNWFIYLVQLFEQNPEFLIIF